MASLEALKAYLGSISYEEIHAHEPGVVRQGIAPFVTISRQAGAGGHTLAEEIRRLFDSRNDDPAFRGWHAFDHALCHRLLEDPELHVSIHALLSEEYHSQIDDIIISLLGNRTPQDVVVKRMFQVIRTLATLGKVIIVGRAASCVTRDLPNGVHVRLVADESLRIERMMHLLHMDEKQARKTVQQQDHDRVELVKTHFGRRIDDPLLYDAVWNTGTVSIDSIASSIMTLIQHKMDSRKVLTAYH